MNGKDTDNNKQQGDAQIPPAVGDKQEEDAEDLKDMDNFGVMGDIRGKRQGPGAGGGGGVQAQQPQQVAKLGGQGTAFYTLHSLIGVSKVLKKFIVSLLKRFM